MTRQEENNSDVLFFNKLGLRYSDNIRCHSRILVSLIGLKKSKQSMVRFCYIALGWPTSKKQNALDTALWCKFHGNGLSSKLAIYSLPE